VVAQLFSGLGKLDRHFPLDPQAARSSGTVGPPRGLVQGRRDAHVGLATAAAEFPHLARRDFVQMTRNQVRNLTEGRIKTVSYMSCPKTACAGLSGLEGVDLPVDRPGSSAP
jgi:hypothetical protein